MDLILAEWIQHASRSDPPRSWSDPATPTPGRKKEQRRRDMEKKA